MVNIVPPGTELAETIVACAVAIHIGQRALASMHKKK